MNVTEYNIKSMDTTKFKPVMDNFKPGIKTGPLPLFLWVVPFKHKETIVHGHDRHNTTVLSIIHNMLTTCFGQYYFWPSSGWIKLPEKTNLLTPWCRVLLEKLTGLQLVKKFPAFLRNPKIHYRTHKRPPPVPVVGQPNPVHIPTSHLLEIHPNIIHPSMPRSPQWYIYNYYILLNI